MAESGSGGNSQWAKKKKKVGEETSGIDCEWSLILAIPAKYTRAREKGFPRGDAPRGEAPNFRRLLSWRVSSREPFSRARVYFAGFAKIRDYSQSTSGTGPFQIFLPAFFFLLFGLPLAISP